MTPEERAEKLVHEDAIWDHSTSEMEAMLAAAIRAAVAEEREACAKVAESLRPPHWDQNNIRAKEIADAIRQRG